MFKQTLSIIQRVHICVSATATWELIAQELTKAVRRFWAPSGGEVHEPVTSRLCLALSEMVHITCSSKYVASMKNWQTFTGHARELTSGLAVRAKTVRANHESAKRWNWAKNVRKVSAFGCQAQIFEWLWRFWSLLFLALGHFGEQPLDAWCHPDAFRHQGSAMAQDFPWQLSLHY